MKSEKFLEFNGKTIFFQSYDGQFWIAIKPICDALNVDYVRAYKNLKDSKILVDALSNQTMRDTKNRLQKMVSLPEKYIYGWIFSLKSPSPELEIYQRECYDVLYNYFHGTITGRTELLKKKIEIDLEYSKAQNSLLGTSEFLKIQELKKQKAEVAKSLKNNDEKAEKEIIDLFHQPE